MLATAEKAHIKIAETSRRQVCHQESESFLHGSIVQIVGSNRILAFAAQDDPADRTRDYAAGHGYGLRAGLGRAQVGSSLDVA